MDGNQVPEVVPAADCDHGFGRAGAVTAAPGICSHSAPAYSGTCVRPKIAPG